jgi:3-phenylpropionate/trans-cinnamate dioxygenase ferredoxin reductase subunit
VPGTGHDNVFHLRTMGDAVRLRASVNAGARVAIIGGGWIGTEVAASLRQKGADVVLVHQGAAPLASVLGPRIGEVFARLHAERGVMLRTGVRVVALCGRGAVDAVELSDGTVEPADLVVVAVGAVANVELVQRAGIAVRDGVLVDEHLESSAPGVFAAGDVASAYHPWYASHVQVGHWANALNQGETAGRNATGPKEVYARVPYFFSDQYDVGLEYVGRGRPDDALVVRGDVDGREFVCFWHRDGAVTAAMAMNTWDVVEDMKALTTAGPIDLHRLADPDVPLNEMAGAAISAA